MTRSSVFVLDKTFVFRSLAGLGLALLVSYFAVGYVSAQSYRASVPIGKWGPPEKNVICDEYAARNNMGGPGDVVCSEWVNTDPDPHPFDGNICCLEATKVEQNNYGDCLHVIGNAFSE